MFEWMRTQMNGEVAGNMMVTAKLSESSVGQSLWARGRFWILHALLLATAFTLGWWMHSGVRVQAQSTGDVLFQIKGINIDDALTLYYPDKKAIYVYQGILTGNSYLGCTYRFQLGKPGAPITRHICPVTEIH